MRLPFEVIADYCSNVGHFASLNPLWRFRAKGSLKSFLFALIELFSLGFTAEALRATIDWKLALLKRVDQFLPNFHVVGDVPREPFFARIGQ